jgi:hypothetical protein
LKDTPNTNSQKIKELAEFEFTAEPAFEGGDDD